MISTYRICMYSGFTNLMWAAVVDSEGRLLLFLKMRIAEDILLDFAALIGGSLTGPVVLRK